ncbi:RluA family pseudouridine synthase [Neolewinella antarctica]|uniref:23S rRNA pseudouridine1911/1915/1917 synthase n=1 Tax=Neolewinella antarctica TaxID=442734 RepID=A0ABX0XAG2_9BACT|nr:RNA pseudouridine synthase [Neolewinella antarctica]NJC26045.1 23S rRNA pseudouridine1911/1915/1917 synthase [Neolewinella antarctica]
MTNLLTVLRDGAGFVVIHKPAGIPTEAYADHDTVEARAWKMYQRPGSPKLPFVGIVHRLDRPVSGVLVLARNKSTLRRLNQAFADKQVSKHYLARTQVPLPGEVGTLRHFLVKDNLNRRATVHDRAKNGAKLSTLKYRLRNQGNGFYAYEIEPITGRYHQIRAQLAAAGAPIIGDEKYGSPIRFRPNEIMLHAHRLAFPDAEGGVVEVEILPDW